MIIGRKNEQAIFSKLLQSKQAEFLTIYGRRRVGKTFLIREFFQKEIVFEFTGAFEAELSIQLFNFFTELQRSDSQLQQKETPKSWAVAFNYLAEYLYRLSDSNQKIVVFIDELPWLDTPNSGFMSAFEYFWNQHGSKIKNLLLVTCGSAASWIIQNLINAKGGFYNRITQKIELKPFSLSETALFFESKNLKFTHYQIAQLYMVMGGIPFYLQAIEQGKSVNQVIDSLCFDVGGLLSNEFKPLFYSLFKNAENHISIIEVLASHPYGLSRTQLLALTKIPNGGTFVRVLDNLIHSGFVVLLSPYGKKEREAVFRITDFYSIFFLKFIQNNVSNRPNTWQSLANSSNFNAWTGYAFENICLQHLNNIHSALGISGVFTKISSWRFAGNDEIDGAQVDMVIDRNDGIIHLCEAKFSSKEYIITKEYIAKLRHKRAAFEHITKTKKAVVTSLLTTYPATKNKYYNEEIHSEISLEALF
jgi:uncharacterized protein